MYVTKQISINRVLAGDKTQRALSEQEGNAAGVFYISRVLSPSADTRLHLLYNFDSAHQKNIESFLPY